MIKPHDFQRSKLQKKYGITRFLFIHFLLLCRIFFKSLKYICFMKRIFSLFGMAFIFTTAFSQNQSLDYTPPIQEKLVLNGSFGELRNHHFHSGVDFGTFRKTGLPIVAVTDGVINRIKVSSFGYGWVVYLRHNDGYSTVYAHLESFAEPIASYVKNAQYKNQSFDIELFPTQNELKIKKGDVIGYSGNTGNSGGPHLHFELRETASERTINPFLKGIFSTIQDSLKPVVNSLWAYPIGNHSTVKGIDVPILLDYQSNEKGEFVTETLFAQGEIGFGVNSHDILQDSGGKNGLFELKMYVDEQLYTHIQFDDFLFIETRTINTLTDYQKWRESKIMVQKFFQTGTYRAPMYKQLKDNGILKLSKGNKHLVKLELSDFHGNTQVIKIPVVHKKFTPTKKERTGKYIDYYKDYVFENEGKSVAWSALTLAENAYLDIDLSGETIKIHEDIIPVFKDLDIRFDVSNREIDKEKSFIGRIDNGKILYCDTWKKGNDFRTRVKNLGVFNVYEDLDAPIIEDRNSQNQYKFTDVLQFYIKDKLSGIQIFNGYINGKWVLFTYEHKSGIITHALSDTIAVLGKNTLTIEVTDKVGNKQKLNYEFVVE